MKEIFIFSTIHFILINFIKGNYIIMNFYKDKYISPNYTDNIFYSRITTDISFGTPEYNISLDITTDSPYFVVKGSNEPNEYKQENSSSFYFIKYGHRYSYKNIYFHSVFFNENFTINESKINLISMMNWSKNKSISYNYGIIGLQLNDIKFQEKNIFLNQLFDKGLIKDKIFTLIYESESRGVLVIGDLPYNKTDLLHGKKFKFCNNSFITNGIVYGTIFEEIKFTEKFYFFKKIRKKETNYIGIFSNYYYGFIGSKEYNNFINETSFKDKLKSKSCWTHNLDDDRFYGYICNGNVDTSNIHPIKFYHKGLDYIFEIKNEEMWISHNDLKYFLVYFSFNNQYSWILGQKFLEKYPIVLNGDKNMIGLYYIEKKETFSYFYICIIFFLFVILIIFIYYKYIRPKCIRSSLKKKLEDGIELEDILI